MLEGMIDAICGGDLATDLFDTLNVNLMSAGGAYGSVYTFAQTIYNAIMPIGVSLLLVYFLVDLIKKASAEQFNTYQFVHSLIMLIASKIVMEHGFDILTYLFSAGHSLLSTVNNAGSISTTNLGLDTAAIVDDFRSSLGLTGLLKTLGDLVIAVSLLFPYIISWAMRIAVKLIVYSRMISIYAHVMLAPIALSDFYAEGRQGAGWKFLKSFFSTALQGALILGIGYMYSALFATITYNDEGLFSFLIPVLAVQISAIMAMFKAQSITDKVVGL